MGKSLLLLILFFVTSYSNAQQTVDNWATKAIDVESAWQQEFRGQGVVVALIGSGVDIYHQMLQDNIHFNPGEVGLDSNGRDKRFNDEDDDENGFKDDWAGFDFPAGTGRFMRPSLHTGTYVAGVIAAHHHDTMVMEGQMQGIAPEARILPINFVNSRAGADPAHLLQAIDYAVLRGARIINFSWSIQREFPGFRDKLLELEQQDILVVNAAGNDGLDVDRSLVFPAEFNLPFQITTGAHERDTFNLTAQTNFGRDRVHIMSPGEQIITTGPGGQFVVADGTSLASGFVSGLAAILWSAYPNATVDDISEAILVGTIEEPLYSDLTWTGGRLSVSGALDVMGQIFPAGTGGAEQPLPEPSPNSRVENSERPLRTPLENSLEKATKRNTEKKIENQTVPVRKGQR